MLLLMLFARLVKIFFYKLTKSTMKLVDEKEFKKLSNLKIKNSLVVQ